MIEIVAHRGASSEAPENTLAAFRLGYEQADACELDIHLSKDGRVVVIHDANTKRTAAVDKPVAEQTLAELRALDAGKGEKIPLLAEVLALIPEGKRLFIEIKCGPEVIAPLVAVIDEAKRKPEQTALIAFNLETLRQAKQKLPKLQAYWLVGSPKNGKPPEVETLVQKCKDAGVDGLDVDGKLPVDAAFVGRVHAAGLKLYTWTVNDSEVAKREAAAGVDGITTDKPLRIKEALAK